LIPIKKIETETNKQTGEIFSALNWHTHQVKNTWIAKTNWFTTNSTRPLIGNIDNENLKFTLTRLRPFIELFLPQLIVRGHIKIENENKIIVLKFIPGLYTTAIYLSIICMIGNFIWTVFSSSVDKEFIIEGIFGFITILTITVLITIWEQIKTKDIVLAILGIKMKQPANIV
jgi:hypothetical protein